MCNNLPGGGKKDTPRQHGQNLGEEEASDHEYGVPGERVLRKTRDPEVGTCRVAGEGADGYG